MHPYVILPVQPILRPWVESIFIMKMDFETSDLKSIYQYPWSVSTHLYFTISDEPLLVKEGLEEPYKEYPPNFIVGPYLTNYLVDLGRYRHVAAIAFRPGGLHRLLQLPSTEITNIKLDASLVWSRDIRDLSEQLKNATDNQEIFHRIEGFLMGKLSALKPISAFDYAIREFASKNGNLSISRVADLACLSVRQFERKAFDSLGVSPKLFGRITRFTNASVYRESHPNIPWAQLAYQFGFCDQMHLIKDFKKFFGFRPGELDKFVDPDLKMLTGIEGRI